MSFLGIACGLAVLAAVGHSVLSERFFLVPLREERVEGSAFSGDRAKRLATMMFHMASVAWLMMATTLLFLEPGVDGYRATLHLFAAVFAISGIGNFWGVGRIHPGGLVLLAASASVLCALYV